MVNELRPLPASDTPPFAGAVPVPSGSGPDPRTVWRDAGRLRSIARAIYRWYEDGVWRIGSSAIRLLIFGGPRRPRSIRSVIHISVLSHKPFMLSRLTRRFGLRSEYLAVTPDQGWLQFGERGYDYSIHSSFYRRLPRPWMALWYVWFVAMRYDVVHYHFGSLLTRDGRELAALKEMGKIVVFHFRGCDLRQGTLNVRLNPGLNCCAECDYPKGSCEIPSQYLKIALARRYGDLLFVTTPDLLDFLPEAEHLPFIQPYGIDMETVRPSLPKGSAFRIVTSSNHHGVDGTPSIRRAVERLRGEGVAVELVEVTKTPYEKALAVYRSADLFIGKLRMGYYNNANIECLVMGIPCMSYIRELFLAAIPDCPIINARPETVYDRIKECLVDPEGLRAIAARGPAFVQKHHHPDRIMKRLLSRYAAALEKKRVRDKGGSAP